MQLTQSTPLNSPVKGHCACHVLLILSIVKGGLKNLITPYIDGRREYESMLCPIKFFFACCIMHVTYSYQHFSAFQMSILPLQFELNLNSFLYFNKNLQS